MLHDRQPKHATFKLKDAPNTVAQRTADELLLFFNLTRTHIHAITIGDANHLSTASPPAAKTPHLPDDPLAFRVSPVAALESPAILVWYYGDQPQLHPEKGQQWAFSEIEELPKCEARTLAGLKGTKSDYIKQVKTSFAAAMKNRKGIIDRLATSSSDKNLVAAMKFFYNMDLQTNGLGDITGANREAAIQLNETILPNRLHRRSAQLCIERVEPHQRKHVRTGANLLRKCLDYGKDPIDEHFAWFLSGKLQPHLHENEDLRPAWDFRVKTTHGMPDGSFFFHFAEACICFADELEDQAPYWNRRAATMVWAADIFASLYWDGLARGKDSYNHCGILIARDSPEGRQHNFELTQQRRRTFLYNHSNNSGELNDPAVRGSFTALIAHSLRDDLNLFPTP